MNGSLIIFLLPVLLVVLLVNSQRRRSRQAAAVQNELVPGVQICTTSGMFATVVSVTDREIVVEAAPGVHLRFDRRAVGLVVPSGGPDGASADDIEHPPGPDDQLPGADGHSDTH